MLARSSCRLLPRVLARTCSSGSVPPTLWHNPDCSKSRACLKLLEDRGEPFAVREYLETPPTFSELRDLQKQLALPPIEWCRTAESAWRDYFNNVTQYDDLLPDDEDILRGIAKHPAMMERPILSHGARAVIGRPPERILELLDGPVLSPEDEIRAAAAVEVVSAAAAAAVARGVDVAKVERSLLGVASQLHML